MITYIRAGLVPRVRKLTCRERRFTEEPDESCRSTGVRWKVQAVVAPGFDIRGRGLEEVSEQIKRIFSVWSVQKYHKSVASSGARRVHPLDPLVARAYKSRRCGVKGLFHSTEVL